MSPLLALGGSLMLAAAAAAAPTITEYQLPRGDNTNPMYIVAGPRGQVWFADEGLNAVQTLYNAGVGEINPSTHAIQEWPTGLASGSFGGFTAGPDGNLWFTDVNAPAIGVFYPSSHTIKEFSSGQPNASQPEAIAAGPDGGLWFTDDGDNPAIGEINPTTHAIQDFALPANNSGPAGIAPGPNGEMWFTVGGYTPAIGEIDVQTHAIQEFSTGLTVRNQPVEIAEGPDGNMWFTDARGAIGEINPSTHVIQEFTSGLTSGAQPYGIAKGPGGNMWFTDTTTPAIGAFDVTTHAIGELTSSSLTQPAHIAAGPGGNMWFTDPSTPAIGEVTLTSSGGGGGGGGGGGTPSVGHVTVSGEAARVPISCHGSGTCAFTLTLSVTETIRGGKVIAVAAHATTGTTKKVVVVGKASRRLSGGHSATVTIGLNAKGRGLLGTHHRLKIKLAVTSERSTIATTTLTLVMPLSRH